MGELVGGTQAARAQNKGKSRDGIRVNVEEMYVNPMCINASNAYHQCTENCLQRNKKRIQIKEGKRVQNGEIREEVVGQKYVDSKKTLDTGITVQNGEITEEEHPDTGITVQNREIREEVVGEKYVDSKKTLDTGITVQNGEISEEEEHPDTGITVQNGEITEEEEHPDTGEITEEEEHPDTGITVQIGEIREEVVGEKYVYSKKTPETRRQSMGENPGHAVQNRERSEEARVAKGRNVDPMCVNASNPYHRCAEYCSQRSHVAAKRTGVSRLERSMENMKIGENKNADPSCVNASNPYHKCGEYCLQRRHKVGLVTGGKPEGNKGGLKKVERMDVNPRCRHGTNPYHKCTDHCLQRIKGAT